MWKRLNNPRGTRQPAQDEKASSGPTSLGFEVTRIRHRLPESSHPPPRPPREDAPYAYGLPNLSFDSAPASTPANRSSTFRPASSVYSSPSPNALVTTFPPISPMTSSTTFTAELSPPNPADFTSSSKQSGHIQHDYDVPVSPIDEDIADNSRLGLGRPRKLESKPPSTSIPNIRREKRRNQVVPVTALSVPRREVGDAPVGRKTIDVRWDPHSGEQTTSDRGKPQSVKPGAFTPPRLRPVDKPLANDATKIKGYTSFTDRVRKLKINNDPADKLEWRGSVRTAVLSPGQDQTRIPPVIIPRKSSKRLTSPPPHPGSAGSALNIADFGVETDGASSPVAEDVQAVHAATRSGLSDSARNWSPVLDSPASIAPRPLDPSPMNSTASNYNPIRPRVVGNPSRTSSTQHRKKDSADTIERNFREAFKNVSFASTNPLDTYEQPPSRFSVTTYATSSEARSTPRPSTDTFDRPPMPTPPQTYTIPPQGGDILNRKRPKVIPESPKSTARKAINPSSPIFVSMSAGVARRASNNTKTLPQSPAEAQSHDLITSLEAQLDDLAHRRNNIMRSIRQMTELMPTDSVLVTEDVRRKREREKSKVEGLREEEADIRRLEHEIGLRLHRAWKRKDKDAVYEPTGLWVRRVTG